LSRERRVEVDGESAEAVLGDLGWADERIEAVVEGEGPRSPADKNHANSWTPPRRLP
jgi:hypothetical protein